ncbi:hypothetical protein L2E82_46016 [Cichorium intybus]|uniref:Uncharacterized protein n=1 Tax=Cichorium intybus TaxID=13427 RepID=A0ACB8ZTL2_CICIN|nr:hypothetical protein L2E82_46016 [Cichorium intybus]
MRHIVVCIECFGILSYVKMGLNGNIYMITILFGDMWDCCLHLTVRQTTGMLKFLFQMISTCEICVPDDPAVQ